METLRPAYTSLEVWGSFKSSWGGWRQQRQGRRRWTSGSAAESHTRVTWYVTVNVTVTFCYTYLHWHKSNNASEIGPSWHYALWELLLYAISKIRFWSLEGQYRGIVFVFCQRNGLLFKLLDVSWRVIVVKNTAKGFGGDFDLVRRNWTFPEIMNPYFKHQGALIMLDFAQEHLPQPRGADLRGIV